MEFPVEITKIEVQKRNGDRASLFFNHEFAFGLDTSVILKLGLKKGDRLTEEQVSELLLKEEKKRLKAKAYRFLSGRAHSEKELRTKLLGKGFDLAMIDEVISELKALALVDDDAFALSYTRSRLASRPLGEKRLRYELRQKGLDEEIIEKAVEAAYREKDQVEFARELVVKKSDRLKGLKEWEKKKRLGDLLARRGFDWDLVRAVVSEKLD